MVIYINLRKTKPNFTLIENKIALYKAVDKMSDEAIAQELRIPVQRVVNAQRKVKTRRNRNKSTVVKFRETSTGHCLKIAKHWSKYYTQSKTMIGYGKA